MEARTHPRVLTLKTAKIFSDGMPEQTDCAILNISNGGAALLVPDLAVVPMTFTLVIDPYGLVRSCQLRWRAGNRVGVQFTDLEEVNAIDATEIPSI